MNQSFFEIAKVAPYAWQTEEVANHAITPKRALFCSPRTGKTLGTLESLRRYIQEVCPGTPFRVLVVSPITFAVDWADYLEAMGLCERLYEGSSKDARDFTAEYNRDKKRKTAGNVESAVITYGMLGNVTRERRNEAGELTSVSKSGCIEQLLNWRPHAVIIDEAHRISGVSSKQGRACRRLAWNADWVRTLTGTPVPNHPGSMWGHMVCIDPEYWEGAYGRFQDQYLTIDSFIHGKVLGWKNEEIASKFQSNIRENACVVSREDVFGPDSWTYNTRRVHMPVSAWKVYSDLAKKWIADLEGGNLVEANHMLTRMMMLQQVACGFVKDENGIVHDLHKEKAKAIGEDLSEIYAQGEKVVIFYKYVKEGDAIKNEILKKYPHRWFRHIQGNVKAVDRKKIAEDFNAVSGNATILAQIQTLTEGCSLKEAHHVFYASQTFSFILEAQSRDRVYAFDGSKALARVVTHYRVPGTIEDYIAKVVAAKVPMHNAIMQINRKDLGI